MRGEIELKLGGELRPLKFGINQSAKFCEVNGNLSLAEYWGMMASLGDGSFTPKLLIDLVYSACWAASDEVDFTTKDVGDWIDTSEDDLTEILLKVAQALSETSPKVKDDKKKQKVAQ